MTKAVQLHKMAGGASRVFTKSLTVVQAFKCIN